MELATILLSRGRHIPKAMHSACHVNVVQHFAHRRPAQIVSLRLRSSVREMLGVVGVRLVSCALVDLSP